MVEGFTPVGNVAVLTDVLAVVGATRDAFNYWRKAGHLQTTLRRPRKGFARGITRENALEIGFMSVLTAAGKPPAVAKEIVGQWLQAEREGGLAERVLTWRGASNTWAMPSEMVEREFPFVGGPMPEGMEGQDRTLAEYVQIWINLGLLVERVDALFKEPDEDSE